MIVKFNAEVYLPALKSYNYTSTLVESALELALDDSQIRNLEVEIRYVPIIMDKSGKERYPARSRLEKKKRIYYCCPQLKIEPFLTGTPEECLREYIGGMRECGLALTKLGATEEQVAAFNLMLDQTLSKLTTERSTLSVRPSQS